MKILLKNQLYTITSENEVQLVSAILEWFNHKDYERKFRY